MSDIWEPSTGYPTFPLYTSPFEENQKVMLNHPKYDLDSGTTTPRVPSFDLFNHHTKRSLQQIARTQIALDFSEPLHRSSTPFSQAKQSKHLSKGSLGETNASRTRHKESPHPGTAFIMSFALNPQVSSWGNQAKKKKDGIHTREWNPK